MPPENDDTEPHLVRADLITGVLLVALGLAMVYWSWTMPRLEVRRIHPLTVPGLVPGLLGVALTLCGAILGLRSLPVLRDPAGWRRFAALLVGLEARRAALVAILALVYALGLVGRMPFWLATTIFVFAFIVIFDCLASDSPRPWRRTAVAAGIQAVVLAAVVVIVFERGFLVRLP